MTPLDAATAPSWVVFQLLEHCNLRCSMCYEWGDTGAYHGRRLASLDLPVVLRTIRECLPSKPFFELFGGEPLLYPGIWEVLDLIIKGGSEVAFSTNGTTVEEHAERLLATPPSLIWLSIDGPEEINDRQRGKGVFARAMRGLEKLERLKSASSRLTPRLGLTYVVTPGSADHVERLLLREIDLSRFAAVSIELQSYATASQIDAWESQLREEFCVTKPSTARGYLRDPKDFSTIDCAHLTRQLIAVRAACVQRGVSFYSQPSTLERSNLESYLSGRFEAMADHHSRCAVPWVHAEVSARGEVTACHSFYDLPIGNVYEQTLLEIWRGPRMQQVRASLREKLFPICTACCRYYNSGGLRRPGYGVLA